MFVSSRESRPSTGGGRHHSHARIVAITTITILSALLAACGSSSTASTSNSGGGGGGGNSSAPAATPLPTATLLPTATPLPTATKPPSTPYVLCQAGGQYGWQGWDLSGSWKLLNGVLLNDGTTSDSSEAPNLVPPPPCQPSSPDYLVEFKVQIDQQSNGNLGINIRQQSTPNGYSGYADSVNIGSNTYEDGFTLDDLANGQINSTGCCNQIGTDYHTYAIKVQGNVITILFDGGVQLQATDNRYLAPGQIGLWSDGLQLQANSFKVTILP